DEPLFTNTVPAPPVIAKPPRAVVFDSTLVPASSVVYSTEIAPPPPLPRPFCGVPPLALIVPVPARACVVIHTEPPAPPSQLPPGLPPLAWIAPSTCTRCATIRTVPPPRL